MRGGTGASGYGGTPAGNKTLKSKVDENLQVECAESLRAAGYDVETLSAEALSGSQVAVLRDHCKKEGRILITLDFGSLRVYPPRTTLGW